MHEPAQKRSYVSLPYVCPEPVLVKCSFATIEQVDKEDSSLTWAVKMADRLRGDDADILKCHAAHPRLWVGLVLVEKVDHERRCFIIRIHPRRVPNPADPNPAKNATLF